MSKVVVSLPQGIVKNSAVGGLMALGVYGAAQLLWALLIQQGVMGFEALYPLACLSAGVASFVGCGYSVLRGSGRPALSVPAVIVVFLALTLAAAFLTTDAAAVGDGLTGVGLAMAAGGLLAAIVGGRLPRNRGSRSRKRAVRRRS